MDQKDIFVKKGALKLIPKVRLALQEREKLDFWELQAITGREQSAAVVEGMMNTGEMVKRGEYYYLANQKPPRKKGGPLLRGHITEGA